MSRFRIDHPSRPNIHAEAGHDPVLGFFVDVMREGRDRPLKSYNHFSPTFNRARPLLGCLDFLVAEGFFTGEQLEDALAVFADDLDVPTRLVRVVEVIERFKSAAD
jgi:hypothetical protein